MKRRITSPMIAAGVSLLVVLCSASSVFAGISFISGQGVMLTGADGVMLTGADGVMLTGADGVVLSSAQGVMLTGADGVMLTGADALTYTGLEGIMLTGADQLGLQGFDAELAMVLNGLPDTSFLNVFVVFHHQPTNADLDSLRAVGVLGGTMYHNPPMVMINATKGQIAAISQF